MSALRVLGRASGTACLAVTTGQLRGRPHRFHDELRAVELAAPVLVEAARRRDRSAP